MIEPQPTLETALMTSSKTAASLIGALAMLAACQSPDGQGAPLPAAPARFATCAEAARDSGAARLVAAAARAFAQSLDQKQRAALVQPFTLRNAIRWSNYPSAVIPRAGVPFGDMTPQQTEAANALVKAAAGACGAALLDGNRAADVIGNRAIAYIGPEHHYISFNGEPSETAPWMLMIGGHHIALNFVFNDKEPGATPLFAGSDPARFVDQAGVPREPVKRQSEAMATLAQAVAAYPEAHLPGVYTDLVKSVVPLGAPPPVAQTGRRETPAEAFARADRTGVRNPDDPRGTDTTYPQSYPTGPLGRGVSYARLTQAQKLLVRRAIEAFAALPGRRLSEPLLPLYESPEALDQTYVSFSGDPNLVMPNAYARIDGPRVWIEMSVQQSLNDPRATHFHSVWRDKVSDYGGHFKS
jgi:hypothetical protein